MRRICFCHVDSKGSRLFEPSTLRLGVVATLTLIWLSVAPVFGQDEACKALRAIHRIHDVRISSLLNDKGLDCLAAKETPTSSLEAMSLFKRSGRGNEEVSVDLGFSPGIYRLRLLPPPTGFDYEMSAMVILLSDIIDVPEGCFPLPFKTAQKIWFPSQVGIDVDCRIFATFEVHEFGNFENERWSVSIAEYFLSATSTSAESWIASGRGDGFVEFDLLFNPGIYRFDLAESFAEDYSLVSLEDAISNPRNCLTVSELELPSQVRIREECRTYGMLIADLNEVDQDKAWIVSVSKLD